MFLFLIKIRISSNNVKRINYFETILQQAAVTHDYKLINRGVCQMQWVDAKNSLTFVLLNAKNKLNELPDAMKV
jgi:hypothetical protein